MHLDNSLRFSMISKRTFISRSSVMVWSRKSSRIENHQKELDKLVSGKASDRAWIKYFKQYGNVRKLDRVLLVMLIDRIEVYGNSSLLLIS